MKDISGGVALKQEGPSIPLESCPTCGENSYARCGAVATCYNDLCPSGDDDFSDDGSNFGYLFL